MKKTQSRRVLRLLVVDDHPVVREGLRAMLSDDAGLEIVGEAGSGDEALEQVNRLEPDVVLMDVRMPGMSGIESTQRIKAERPQTAVIVLTTYDSETYVVEALRAGAAGYLAKASPRELVCDAVNAAVDGGTIVESSLLRRAIEGQPRASLEPEEGQVDDELKERLTARELDVLALLARGYSNKEIAGELSLAESTVKKYAQLVIAKLHVSDRTQAAILAVRSGMI